MMPERRSSVTCICPILFTYKTILLTSLVLCLQRKFEQGPSALTVTHRTLIHWDTLYMSCNQDSRMITSSLSGCQGIGELNIWEPLICITSQWAYSVTYKLATSALGLIWYLMTSLRICMQGKIKNLQFGQNLSPFNPSRVHMTMRDISLTLLISG